LYYKVLKPGAIAEVVIPDGILTNSSAQDVRDFISERFRILAVISLPQYTFSHYGAGVKSSIIILKKLDYNDTRRLQSSKMKYLENAVAKHEADLKHLENEKKNFVASYPDFLTLQGKQNDDEKSIQKQLEKKPDALKKQLKANIDFYKNKHKEIIDSEEFKKWKKAKDDDLNDQIKSLKAHIYELANFNFKEFEKEWNYPIFMTVAENIGYDATGRETRKNDLPLIAQELKRFLKSVEDKKDDFFALTLP
jgi:type I restriction enzyme M protein